MERLVFKKVEIWILGLCLVAGFLCMLLFGAIVLDEERGRKELGSAHFGEIGKAAMTLAEIPENTWQAFKKFGRPDTKMMPFLRLPPDDDLPDGWSWIQPPGSNGLTGYLLLSRYNGDQTQHEIELMSLETGEVHRTWSPKPEMLLATVDRLPEFDGVASYENWNNAYFRYIHPYLTEDGRLLLKNHNAPLFMMSPCGDIEWSLSEYLFHHSTSSDGEGGFWIPSYQLDERPEDLSPKFARDTLVQVSSKGEVLVEEALDEILVQNGLRHLLFPAAHFYSDPMHLNDIEPVLTSGPHWQKGDLFLSLRTPSLVALYRPSTREIIWSKAGPWLSQHDVDILDDHRIAVFNNNAYDRGLGARVEGVSEILIYDFKTGSVESPFREVLKSVGAATVSEGLQDFTPSGHVIFEEANRGRIFVLDGAGKMVATFVNRAENGEAYFLGWSRYVSRSLGEKALRAIAKSGC
ncbi:MULTISPECIES: arylsulfotransferase family protein [unclassified Ruegeria]|uniref:arylsulfotransferase family protein n=1 Tax=unclassified Ruegeria TaxID=2625375 RepID=UPI001AE3660E|nr:MULTISPECIES: arylsulfotransferase family protein [unclassified Ruegeria]